MARDAYQHSSDWTVINPVLNAGERGVESDTGYSKVGNGNSNWNRLPYAPAGGLYRGTFASNTNQSANNADEQKICTFDPGLEKTENYGISQLSTTAIEIEHPGVYLVNLNLHVENTATNAVGEIHTWVAKNADRSASPAPIYGFVPGTTVKGTVPFQTGSGDNIVVGAIRLQANHVMALEAGDKLEFYWEPSITQVQLKHAQGSGEPARPHRHAITLEIYSLSAA